MKTRMKKLISISTIPVLAVALLLVLGTVLADDGAQAKKTTPPLTCTMEYFFVGHLGEVVDGRLLCWVGPIHGDIDGWAQWRLLPELPPPGESPPKGQVGHMLFTWEIWSESPWMYDEAEGNLILDEDGHLVVNPDVEADLLLAGTENERTIVRHGKNSVWRANGVVTEASEEFEDYIGSQTHDGGNFTWAAPGLPEHGFGTFRIAGSAAGSK
jgi:hypothetical protein